MISVVIPTYKNKDGLLKNLRHNLTYLKDCQIIIVNDNPETSLKEDMKKFPAVTLVENKKNLGFALAANLGAERATGKFIFLLNDDVTLNDDGFTRTSKQFGESGKLFAVSFAQEEKTGSPVGKNRLFFSRGLYQHSMATDFKFGETGWAEGGATVFDGKKFRELGGFDPVYAPFYWEDIDLSQRARKLGWQILFDPSVTVAHHHETTIGKSFSQSYIKTVAYRNQLIFTWKNLDSPVKLLSHVVYLPVNFIYMLLKGETEFFTGFFQAVIRNFL